MELRQLLLIVALILFVIEAIWHRSLAAGGLACLTLAMLL